MRLKGRFLVFGLFLCLNTQAQIDSSEISDEPSDWVKPNADEKSRLGIVMGVQMSTLTGTELSNNKAMFGLLGGGYGRINFKYGLSLQQALQVSFRGGDFNSGAANISAIRLLYLDAPFLIYKQLGKTNKHKLGAGIQYSHLYNTTLYYNNKSYPTGQSPRLNKNDWIPLLAYQYQFDYFAMQLIAKRGLRNLNLGYEWPADGNANPLINKGGSLNGLILELNLIF